MGLFTNKAAKKAEKLMDEARTRLDDVLANRQAIINPYAGVTDLSGLISNPFANLQVATEAAEFQAEEADLSLASTLDTLRATGAGAGGATALAQQAARSKRGVAATIAQQEAQNERLRAQGAQSAQTARLAEGARLDKGRMAGAQFEFGARESRQFRDEDRLAGLADRYSMQAANARAQSRQMFGQAIGAIGGMAAGRILGGKDWLSAAGGGGQD